MAHTPQKLFEPDGVQWTGVSGRLVRARIISAGSWTLLLLAAAIGGAVWWRTWWAYLVVAAVAALLVWEIWLIRRQVRAIGYAERHDDLLIRRGIMFKSLVVVPYGRMQSVDVSVGPLQRWCQIAELKLHTASATTDATLPGLDPAEAARLRDRLSERGEAWMAGL